VATSLLDLTFIRRDDIGGGLMKLKGFIFDMDGVVVENHAYHFQAWMEFARKYKFELNDQIYKDKFNGKTNEDLFRMIFKNITPEQIKKLTLEKEGLYQKLYFPHLGVTKGLYQFIDDLRREGKKIALGTSAPTMNVDFVLDNLKLRGNFDIIVDGSMVKNGKPDPEVYQACCHRMGLSPSDCVVFEDSLAGLESGARAGCKIVGVATSHKIWELKSKTDDVIVDFTDMKYLFR
jgi:beta-phosphoglucomutase